MARAWAALLFLVCLACAGCGRVDGSRPQIVLTTGFGADEVFRIDDEVCTSSEALVYLVNMHNQYEAAYGARIWEMPVEGGKLSDTVKQTVLARLAKIKTMHLLATNYQVQLDDAQEAAVERAASAYYASLSAADLKACGGIRESDITRMYREYALAEAVYRYLTADVDEEISDDEARIIVVQQLTLHSYVLGEDGERIPYTAADRAQLRERIETIAGRIDAGEDFESLALSYNEEDSIYLNVTSGRTEAAVLLACSILAEGEVSPIVETEDGYHIYRCISPYDREQTQQRKEEILVLRQRTAFDAVYEAYAAGRESYINEELWDALEYDGSAGATTSDFFAVYEQYCTGNNYTRERN